MNLTVASSAVISDALAVFLTIWKLKEEMASSLEALEIFKSLSKILDKTYYSSTNGTSNGTSFTFTDDTYKASLPDMKNVIDYFDKIQPFYKGASILILG